MLVSHEQSTVIVRSNYDFQSKIRFSLAGLSRTRMALDWISVHIHADLNLFLILLRLYRVILKVLYKFQGLVLHSKTVHKVHKNMFLRTLSFRVV
jgi:hypothetical protein